MKTSRKNVVLITIDSLRADHVSCFGYHRKTTPNIDRFAKKGVLFTQAFANGPGTPQSFISILTSTYPLMFNGWKGRLSIQRKTIAQVLKRHGYATAAFHSNPYLSSYFNYNRGFDLFEDFLHESSEKASSDISIKYMVGKLMTLRKIWRNLPRAKILEKLPPLREAYVRYKLQSELPYRKAEIINRKAFSWLSRNKENFFIWLHYMDVHSPYRPPKKFLPCSSIYCKALIPISSDLLFDFSKDEIYEIVEGRKILYDGEIRYIDYFIGQLFRKIKEIGVWADTFVILTADHGDEFMEHGDFGHHHKLYDEILHVPLIISGPGIKEGHRINDPVGLIDISPTILDLLGINDIPESFMGKSLVPFLRGRSPSKKRVIISETSHEGKTYLSYRTHKWKYIYVFDEKGWTHKLYDIQKDPKEKENISEKEKNVCNKLRYRLFEHMSQKTEIERIICRRLKLSQRIMSLKESGKI